MLRVVCISRGLSACFLLISLGLSISVVSGQTEPGAPDVSFNGEGVPDWPGLLHLLPAAKILINKFPSTIIRLNANGAVDSTFAAEPLAGLEVRAMLGQPDGKVLAGGISSGRGLARLEASGSRDTNFSSVAVSNVWCIALDHEDILVGGGFTEVNGVPRDHVAKLDTRGNLMPAFAPQLGFQTNDATALYSLTDGGVLVGFNLVGSARTSPWVVRLKSDGGIDPGFVPFIPPTNAAVSPDVQINGFALQADGKLLIHGWFQVAGQNGIMRLQSDGSLDTTFRGTCEPASSQVKYLAMQPDGKILIGGNFTSANGFPAPGLARLKPDGEFDVGFAPALAIGSFTLGLALQEDGKILAAGYDATGSPYLRRLLGGDLPPNPPEILQGPSALTLTSGQTGSFSVRARSRNLPSYQWRKDGNDIQGATNAVLAFRAVAATDGGSYQVLVSNEFGTTASASASLEVLPPSNTPGTIDLSFDPGAGTDDEVTTLAVQRDGRILLTGVFQTVDGAARPGIARLEPNGEVDASFNPGSGFKYSTYLRPPTLIPGPDGVFNLLAELQDGRIVAGGYFTNYDGVACPGIVRLESNGRVDTNFVVASGIEGAIMRRRTRKGDNQVAPRPPRSNREHRSNLCASRGVGRFS
ncbi:MAG: immunoglobulin domain-containing protein [Verrucomicrobiota bacterium]